MQELAAIVETGPDPATDGVVRWRRIDLCAVVERRFGVRFAERGMGEILRRLGFARLSARPRHPQSNAEAQAVYKKLHRSGARGAARDGAGQAAGRRPLSGPSACFEERCEISRTLAFPSIQLRSALIANSFWCSTTCCRVLACISFCAASALMRMALPNHSLQAETISDAAAVETVDDALIA
jgi:hypothetical protein